MEESIDKHSQSNQNKIWFIGDTHFSHANIMKYCNRPFSSVEEMDDVIIQNINKRVKENDMLYHLGDFSFRDGSVRRIRPKINCRNITLILGNHDPYHKGQPSQELYDMFSRVLPIYELSVFVNGQKQKITLCHYAMRVWNRSHHGAYHLYGHSHYSLPDDVNALSVDVGVDAVAGRATGLPQNVALKNSNNLNPQDYRPISLDEVVTLMSKKIFRPIDHHTGA